MALFERQNVPVAQPVRVPYVRTPVVPERLNPGEIVLFKSRGEQMLSKLTRRMPLELLLMALLLVTACGRSDPYEAKFPQVGLGDDRPRVVALMGPPASVNSIKVPLLKAEQWIWRAPGRGRIYTVIVSMDRTVAKVSVE